MFLPWNIAKSAEAMFSRWALKRLFKFVLKKKLGQFIFGDVDLDQLDVQLYEGTIQLNDLALNVDYLNDKLGPSASVIIKEGSIGSLLVKMPWKTKGFRVEVDELEIVVAPIPKNSSPSREDDSSASHATKDQMHGDIGKTLHDTGKDPVKSNIANVHEGVKAIAEMIKVFLTSFHVKVKKLIMAFEPYLEENQRKIGCCRTLVLRISEAECGTCVSEDTNLSSDGGVKSFLGISRLTNFVNFQGATVELLQVDDVDVQTCSPCGSGSSLGELFSGSCQSHSTTPIATGKKGGLSGNLTLSIPWKNGSLDIRKVDADVNIDPLELRFEPSTIKWFLILWETYKNLIRHGGANGHYKPTESVYFNSASHFGSSACFPAMLAADKGIPVRGGFSSASSLSGTEAMSEAMLHGSHLIHDWVPNSVKESEKDGAPKELDLGASVEQFFECFDGIRHSQTAVGNSGMWNWTCSVFNALTAASSLASGSLHVPSEQQHIQTNLKATFAGVSIILSFQDEVLEHFCDPKGNQSGVSSKAHYLGAEFDGIVVVFQVCPQKMRIDGTVKVIEIVDYSGNKGDVADLGLQESNSESKSEIFLTERMQADILGALPPLSSFTEAHCANELNALVASEFPLGSVIKTKLLSTAGITHCQFATTSNLSVGSLTATRSFSLQLPQFVFWVNFCSIDMFLDLLKDIAEMDSPKSEINSVNGNHGSLLVDEKKGSNLDVATLTSTGNWRVNISMPNARLILCPPVRNGKNTRGYSSWDKFLAIDFHSPSTLEDGKVQDTSPRSNASLWERYTSRTTCSLHLSVGNLKIYLVNLFCQGDGLDSSGKSRQKVSAQKVLFVYSRAGSLSKVSMLWQECPVIGSWDIESAKSLATPEEYESRENFTVKGSEYATATSANKKNLDYRNSGTREEIILSSAFFLHVHLFPVIVDIGSSQYVDLHHFLGQMIGVLSDVSREVVCVEDTKSISQTSILVVCESLELSVRPDIKEDIRSSLQNDLPGSWHCLKLRIQKLEMLSVSNVGGIRNANLFWLSHQEGKLWGAITGFPDRELLLISCSNSTRKRGDGGGSNALSSRSAGSDIIYLWDPRNLHAFTSITISCITIVAVGGRLDWLGVISSFFSLPSAEKMDGNLPQGDMNAHYGASFVLKLLDVGLSYEPHMKSSVVGNLHTDSGPSHFNEETGEPFVACLLAASSLYLANIKLEESFVVEYKIRVQDLGLLLCPANENLCGTYNVEYLREMGYVRIAWEALIEAKLRTNCKDGLFWDLECSKSHIYVETCHDTTSGLMRLGAQLQQLFAPDLEDSLVYLQNRWDNVQQAQERNEFDDVDSQESTLSTSPVHVSSVDTGSKPQIVGLMDQICEDAFHLDENQARQFGFRESQAHERFLGEACNLSAEKTGISSNDVYFDGTVTAVESSETSFRQKSFPEVIEGYYLSDSPEIVKSSTGNCRDGDLGRGCNGWYEDAAINIVENHISEESEETDPSQFSVSNFSSVDSALSDDFGKATGRIVLKNIDVSWRMYSGSDWHACKKNGEEPTNCVGRETTACLELTLSGTQFQHVFYPVGGLCASKLSVSVQDFYLCDKSKTAPWKLILGYYHSKNHPRESSSNAFKLDLEAVRPDPQTPLEEYRYGCCYILDSPILMLTKEFFVFQSKL
uniref:Autophagy-related protein 2 n=1 Tax=Rhizophora mucronata TaxID=61149 RepID=A0A2P2KFT1_RHIMU